MTAYRLFAAERRIVWAVVVWGLVVIASLVLLFRPQMVAFDASGRLSAQFDSTERYLKLLEESVPWIDRQSRPTLVRIIAGDCACRAGSRVHWEQMQSAYPEVDFRSVSMDSLPPAMQAMIPATPMALFLTSEGRAVYAGPFSAGALCNSQNSLVEAYVADRVRQPHVPFGAVGCYCPVS